MKKGFWAFLGGFGFVFLLLLGLVIWYHDPMKEKAIFENAMSNPWGGIALSVTQTVCFTWILTSLFRGNNNE